MQSISPFTLRQTTLTLNQGGIIAYPTEAVYGLGCDPMNATAVYRLLALKQRPVEKGLILVAADIEQLLPFLQPVSVDHQYMLKASWPGPNTWLVPARSEVPMWIRGKHTSLAVRVSAHPIVQALCREFGGPIISTSANRTGQPPARSSIQVLRYFDGTVDRIVSAPLGGASRPTVIRDLISGEILRAG